LKKLAINKFFKMKAEKRNDCPFKSLHGTPIKFSWTDSHVTRFEMDRLGEESYSDQDSVGDRIYRAMRDAGENKLFPWFLESTLDSELQTLQAKMSTVPTWVDWELIKQGQQMFCPTTCLAHIFSLTFTLLGGFSIPELNEILISSRYWVGKGDEGRKDTNRRLIMTWIWYCRVMREDLKPEGKGWKEVLEIRMLHSKVRSQLSKDCDSVAISQLHLLATLSGFQYNYLRFSRDRLGMIFEKKELEAWTMLWRYIGYCLGIQEKALEHFADFESSEMWWQSMVEGLLVPDNSTKKLTNHVIASIAENMPYVRSIPHPQEFLRTAYRVMLPIEMGECLGYKSSLAWEFYYRSIIFNYGCFLAFQRFVRRFPILRDVLAVWWICCKPGINLFFKLLVVIYKKLGSFNRKVQKKASSLRNTIELKLKDRKWM